MKSLKALYLFILIFSLQNIAEAQMLKEKALIGLDSLSVSVGISINNIELDILENRLRNRMELRLRQNDITVTSESSNILSVYIIGVPARLGDRVLGYAYHASLELSQGAFLPDNQQFMFPYTYQLGKIATVNKEDISREIRDDVEGLLDEFINEFLKAN